ncbi:Aldo/keto reductase, partial [Cutaneotrichosporon oleaginosum]
VYGTAWKKERTADLVYTALKAGFRGIDTACQPKHYREDLVGVGLQRALADGLVTRDELYLQTKYTSIDGQDRAQALPYDLRAPVGEQVAQSVARSLQNWGVDALDAVVLHSPLRTRAATLEAYRALEACVGEGKIGRLGVSNIYDADELAWLIAQAQVPVSVVQNRWYEGNGWDWPIYDLCQKHGIAYQSFWTLTGSPSLLASAPLRALASRKGCTPEQAVYRLCQLWNITPLCGSTNETHMKEALAVESLFGHDEPEVTALWKAMRG